MSARIAIPLAALGALLAGLVGLGACTLLLAFTVVARAGGPVALGGTVGGALTGNVGGGAAAVGGASGTVGGVFAPSAQAQADIPALYLALYMQAADRFGLDWTILAGIGRVECDHGRDPAPSCTVEGALNYAGAGGPAQFLVSTWQRYGISATGLGTPDMWRPADAILSMANYLHACGAPGDYPRAIFAYNHASWYVAEVLAWAQRYRAEFVPATPNRRNIAAIAGS